ADRSLETGGIDAGDAFIVDEVLHGRALPSEGGRLATHVDAELQVRPGGRGFTAGKEQGERADECCDVQRASARRARHCAPAANARTFASKASIARGRRSGSPLTIVFGAESPVTSAGGTTTHPSDVDLRR